MSMCSERFWHGTSLAHETRTLAGPSGRAPPGNTGENHLRKFNPNRNIASPVSRNRLRQGCGVQLRVERNHSKRVRPWSPDSGRPCACLAMSQVECRTSGRKSPSLPPPPPSPSVEKLGCTTTSLCFSACCGSQLVFASFLLWEISIICSGTERSRHCWKQKSNCPLPLKFLSAIRARKGIRLRRPPLAGSQSLFHVFIHSFVL